MVRIPSRGLKLALKRRDLDTRNRGAMVRIPSRGLKLLDVIRLLLANDRRNGQNPE